MPSRPPSRSVIPPDSAQMPDTGIEPYDFANPNRLSRHVLRTLKGIYEEAARDISQQLAHKGVTSPVLELGEVRSVRADNLVGELPRPTIIEILSVAPLRGTGVLQMDLQLGLTLLNLRLGGRREAQGMARGPSAIEHSVLAELVDAILSSLARSWAATSRLAISVAASATSLDTIHFSHPQESLLLAHFQLHSPDASGDIRFVTPAEAADHVSPLESRSRVQSASSHSAAGISASSGSRHLLDDVSVRFTAQLHSLDLSLATVGGLRAGDVVVLRPADDDSISLVSGDRYRLRGRLVNRGQRLAVRLSHPSAPKEKQT